MKDMKEISRKRREYIENNNPCLAEERLSKKCVEDNNYDHDKCNLYFQNVVLCRMFWDKVKIERRNNGITPYLPPPDERAKIKAEHLKKKAEKELNIHQT